MMRVSAVILVAGLLGSPWAAGPCLSQQWEVYDVGGGELPSNTVRDIAFSANGDVWVGTEFGLARFDGLIWEVYTSSTHPLPDNDIRALAEDDLGRMWIGTSLGGLAWTDGTNWGVHDTQNSPMPADQVRCLAPDTGGYVWAGTIEGLVRTNGSDWRIYDDTPGSYNGLQLPGLNIADVARRDDGLICIGTLNAGFTYLTDTSVTVYNTVDNGLPDNTAFGVALDQQGRRWAACPAGALLQHAGAFQGGVWLQYSTLNSFIPSNALNDVAVDGLDRKIVATQSAGIGILTDPNSWNNYDTQNSGLPDNEVLCVAVADDGAIWLGTAGGGAARLTFGVGLDPEEGSWLAVHPVPADERVTVRLDEGRWDWLLVDAAGRTCLQGISSSGGELRLERRGLAPGTYLVLASERSTGRFRRARVLFR